MMSHLTSRWFATGAILAGLAVAAGAFAAHGLDGVFRTRYAGRVYEKKIRVDGIEKVVATTPLDQKYLADVKTGAEYQMYHSLALLAVGWLATTRRSRWIATAGWLFVLGCLGFSGGLYAYAITDQKWIGMFIVPTGGTLFLAGWFSLAIASIRAGNNH